MGGSGIERTRCRTPRINKDAGRDHWPQVGGALLAGGGFRSGQVIGSTDRDQSSIATQPTYFGEVHTSNLALTPTALNDYVRRHIIWWMNEPPFPNLFDLV